MHCKTGCPRGTGVLISDAVDTLDISAFNARDAKGVSRNGTPS